MAKRDVRVRCLFGETGELERIFMAAFRLFLRRELERNDG